MTRRIKVLLSKLGLDVHNRGILIVAKALSDAGMEVVYMGNSLPRQILNVALQETTDVVGVSSLGGAHLTLGASLLKAAGQEGLKENMVFVIGGVFPPEDASELKRMGFDAVFTPGASQQEIVSTIRDLVTEKQGELESANAVRE